MAGRDSREAGDTPFLVDHFNLRGKNLFHFCLCILLYCVVTYRPEVLAQNVKPQPKSQNTQVVLDPIQNLNLNDSETPRYHRTA